jgi:hypothetical protein
MHAREPMRGKRPVRYAALCSLYAISIARSFLERNANVWESVVPAYSPRGRCIVNSVYALTSLSTVMAPPC